MTLDKVLSDSVKNVPECIAGAYIDMSTGMVLAAKTVNSLPQELVDLVAAATADMFQGKTVLEIEAGVHKLRGNKKTDEHFFQEFLVLSRNLIHVFMRTQKHQQHVVTFVCRKSANVGMVLAKSRLQVEKLQTMV